MTYDGHVWTIAAAWAIAAALMLGFWLWHLRVRNVGVVDVGWTVAVLTSVGLFAAAGAGDPSRRLLVATLVAIWATRLATYLLRDRVLGRAEDGRYQALRAAGSVAAARRFFFFFQAQAVLAVFFAMPGWLTSANRSPTFHPLEWMGLAVWAIGLVGESVADLQLTRFKADPRNRGRTCRAGLWGYSRHPNYFFEWLIWVGYALLALPAPYGPVALAAPALMLYLLFRVTGIPATEAQALRTRGDDYRHYQSTTSAFVPWIPRV